MNLKFSFSCFQDTTIYLKNSSENNVLHVNGFLKPVSCKDVSNKHNDETCEIYTIVYEYMHISHSGISQISSNNKRIIYKELNINDSNCCLPRYWCKTHNVEF